MVVVFCFVFSFASLFVTIISVQILEFMDRPVNDSDFFHTIFINLHIKHMGAEAPFRYRSIFLLFDGQLMDRQMNGC